jgi:hypothetical protein
MRPLALHAALPTALPLELSAIMCGMMDDVGALENRR